MATEVTPGTSFPLPQQLATLTGDPKQHDISEFSQNLKGKCLCGSIQVTINDSELFTRRRGHLCHCANCRKVSGSYASINLIIESDKVDIVDQDGTLTEYKDTETMSGAVLGRWFCRRCGNPIRSVHPKMEGKVIVKMGIFPRLPAPEMEMFAAHKNDWEGTHPGVTSYALRADGPTL